MKDFILTETGKVLATNHGNVFEDGYVYILEVDETFSSKMTKQKIIAESDSSAELELKARELNLKGE